MSDPQNDHLKSVYGARSSEAQKEIYKNWAQTYDDQTTQEFGWIGFETAAKEFATRVTDKHAKILDAGCGTGLSGKALADLGYTHIDGFDFSKEMLEEAERTNVYNSLREVDLSKPIEVQDFYDAIFCVGVFGFGPPHPEHLPNLLHILKPGGLALITVNGNGYHETAWDDILPHVVMKQHLKLKESFEIPYLEKEKINGYVLVFEG